MPEVDNAVNQARKEIGQRFDFKGSTAAIDLDQKASTLTLTAEDNFKLESVWDVLQTDDEACGGLIRSAGGKMGARVALIDGDTSPPDALAYARPLNELGLAVEARDILTEVLRASFGWLR